MHVETATGGCAVESPEGQPRNRWRTDRRRHSDEAPLRSFDTGLLCQREVGRFAQALLVTQRQRRRREFDEPRLQAGPGTRAGARLAFVDRQVDLCLGPRAARAAGDRRAGRTSSFSPSNKPRARSPSSHTSTSSGDRGANSETGVYASAPPPRTPTYDSRSITVNSLDTTPRRRNMRSISNVPHPSGSESANTPCRPLWGRAGAWLSEPSKGSRKGERLRWARR